MVNSQDVLNKDLGQLPERGSIIYAYFLSCVAAVGGLLFGFDTGVISGAIEFIKDEFSLTTLQQGFTVSIVMIGCIFGAMFGGFLSDKYGRKKVLIGTAIFYAISAICSAVPELLPVQAPLTYITDKIFALLYFIIDIFPAGTREYLHDKFALFHNTIVLSPLPLVFARFMGGLAVGVSSVVSPLYIAEISPARIRGRLVALNQMAIVTGILLSYVDNLLLIDIGPDCKNAVLVGLDKAFRNCFDITGGTNWRWMLGAEALPAVILLCGLFFVPESPRWLTKRGLGDRGKAILARIGGRRHAHEEIEDIKMTLAMEEKKGSLFQIFKPGLRFALLIGVSLAILQQITGINIVIYYAPKIFLKAGFDNAGSAFWATVLVGTTNCVMTIIALAVIDKLGRKPLLMIGSAGMGISLVAASIALQSETIAPQWIILPICTYTASFAFGLGPTVWVVMAEIFPTDIRGRAMSIATLSLWVSCFLVSLTFPYFLEHFAEKTFFGYAMVCVFMFFFVIFIVRETKGKTLEEIERSWRIGKQ